MLASNVRAPAGNFIRPFILLRRFARPLHSAATASTLSSSSNVSSPTSSPSSSRARRFWTTDEPLIRALRRRQETYRLVGISNNARKKAERLEAVQLAKSEIRWTVQHVRALQASASTSESSAATSALNRASRRKLISMVAQMTKCNVPISYLLGSVPFGNLPQELTVRPPILLPRPETEHWATEVVDRLVKSLDPTRERGQSIRIVDLCTGSGCIALLVANALRAKLGPDGDWKVVACDRSSLAVDLARENATKLGLLKTDDCFSNLDIVQADIFSDSDMDQLAQLAGGPFDLILSNPPYIPRREWINLNAEVRKHEDPAALIGERSIAPATTTTSSSFSPDNPPSSAPSQDRQSYLDRHGLAFHHRLAELLHRPSFSAFPSTSSLPRLVAEYGKGQQRAVEKLHFEFKAPKDRMPTIVPVKGHTLVVVGVGNATTHPNTRHSIGQVVLEPLLQALIQQDREVRMRLRQIRDGLEENRIEALASGRIDVNHRDDWNQPVILNHLIGSEEMPMGLSKVNIGKSGGWAATMTLLIPCSPQFFSSSSLPDQHEVYQIQVALYKPWQAMNLSGVGVRSFLQSHHPAFTNPTPSPNTATLPRQQGESQEWRIENDLLILQDELDLPFNSVKLKHTGSARGHNGIRDIISRLDIPTSASSTSTSVNRKRGANTEVESGPKLSRIKIGIGRPEHSSNNESNKSSWLPSNLEPRKSKPITVDRWVLSPLTQTELQSCQAQDGQVSTLVKNLTLEWIRERCHFLTLGQVEQRNRVKIRSEKDQFGVFRSVWLE
ncbi:related to MTQ1 - S-adenosylmethionine-dependent methyltransferase [Ustilago trichophora]|uniref:Related to MTQ1 - S-adenosylmethionine-dependent methyltransferase n=1 Tax=Ustilago trichophora TaxID=86804 RepID=A0A5C3E937_9BASI|nr:related to MTQ1 - S-adenosylmethionine-dependent methyltransferase [Ustilago trichophora]